jgi:NTP pyrophosphatase (non-canonical NTP hydrolase)
MDLNEMRNEAYRNSRKHGWWDGVEDGDQKVIPEKLMLTVSELAEAVEDYREGRMVQALDNGKPVGFPSELADAIIRIGDLAGHLGIDLNEAVEMKMAYNRTRPYRHGGKAC